MPDIRGFVFRAVFFYMLVAGLVFFAVDHKTVAQHAWPKTLSRLRVDYSYLISAANGSLPQRAQLIDGKRYFNAIVRIYGSRSDVNAFLGMSAYYMGDISGAKGYFMKLHEAAPGFFWANYNLALLALQDKDYAATANYCQQAFQSPFDKSLAFMMTSKVYQPLFPENGYTPQLLVQNMESGRLFLAKVLAAIKSGAGSSLGQNFPIRVF